MVQSVARWIARLTVQSTWTKLIDKLPSIAAGLVGTLLFYLIVRKVLRVVLRRGFGALIERERAVDSTRVARLMTLEAVAGSAMLYALYFIVVGMALASLGLNLSSLIATAGVAGVAIGFGTQKLVRDVVTGFLLLMEDQFAVGDLVTIGANTGIVEETGMRVTRLRDESGRLIILSNGDIVSVVNYSKGRYRLSVDLAVTPETAPDRMAAVVESAGAKLAASGHGDARPVLVGAVAMSAASVTYRIEATASPAERLTSEARLRAALRDALAENEVKLA